MTKRKFLLGYGITYYQLEERPEEGTGEEQPVAEGSHQHMLNRGGKVSGQPECGAVVWAG